MKVRLVSEMIRELNNSLDINDDGIASLCCYFFYIQIGYKMATTISQPLLRLGGCGNTIGVYYTLNTTRSLLMYDLLTCPATIFDTWNFF